MSIGRPVVSLPEMQEIVESIKSDDVTIAPLGGEINYDAMEISLGLADEVGEQILRQMHQARPTSSVYWGRQTVTK